MPHRTRSESGTVSRWPVTPLLTRRPVRGTVAVTSVRRMAGSVAELQPILAIVEAEWRQSGDVSRSIGRVQRRQQRLDESQPVKDWWRAEREQVETVDFEPEVREMYAQSLSFDKFRREYVSFWQLDDDYKLAEA